MKHYVFWVPEADEIVQKLLASENDPATFVRIFDEIDRTLAHNPSDFGESRYANIRIAFAGPIAIQFEIQSDPPTVIVLDVWRHR